jgi:hypothetical protein
MLGTLSGARTRGRAAPIRDGPSATPALWAGGRSKDAGG